MKGKVVRKMCVRNENSKKREKMRQNAEEMHERN